MRSFAGRFPDSELFYLIGADHVPTLPQWREADALAQILTFVVFPRSGGPDVEFPETFDGRCLEGELMDISSSDIRVRIREGKSVNHLVPSAVVGILSKKQIYR